MKVDIRIQAGLLRVETVREEVPLSDLLAFASRRNERRPFLFVSKVLGKHWPCRPSTMRSTYDRLAEPLSNVPGPVLFVGMCETATALGHGVYDSFRSKTGRDDALTIHTTRHELPFPAALSVDESHSHAVAHLLYEPQDALRPLFREARTLVLVDDEISTGRTLRALALEMIGQNTRIERVIVVAIVSWLSEERRATLRESLPVDVQFVSLLDGTFSFAPDPEYPVRLPSSGLTALRKGRHIDARYGRAGFTGRVGSLHLPELPPSSRVLVVGTGEFAFLPFTLAERLEQRGHDVLFQSTTRSPVARGDAVASKLVFGDHHGEGVTNYLYNRADVDHVVVCYEHPSLAASHELVGLLGATAWTPAPGEAS